MLEVIGWTAAIFLSICGFPQAWHSFTRKHSRDISSMFLFLWGFGCVLMLIYVIPSGSLPLITDYVLNIVFVGVIAYYKWRPQDA